MKAIRRWFARRRWDKQSGRRRIKITATVTESQALALESMLRQWNSLSAIGSSRFVAFYADGDGNFHPRAKIRKPRGWQPLTDDLHVAASKWERPDGGSEMCMIDFDPIAWMLHDD